jgi:hypothetical protein
MTLPDWIVCERTGRWAAALRTTGTRQATDRKSTFRIVEVRRLSELSARFDERATSLALVEVHGNNLSDVLTWLADARGRYGQARFVALLDYPQGTERENRRLADRARRRDIVAALMEAGAVDVADSPRYLQSVMAIAQRHLDRTAADSRFSAVDQPLVEWARSLLPWQDR